MEDTEVGNILLPPRTSLSLVGDPPQIHLWRAGLLDVFIFSVAFQEKEAPAHRFESTWVSHVIHDNIDSRTLN